MSPLESNADVSVVPEVKRIVSAITSGSVFSSFRYANAQGDYVNLTDITYKVNDRDLAHKFRWFESEPPL